MIHVLVGENTFMRSRALATISDGFDGDVQVVDGSVLTLDDLVSLLTSMSLFAKRRLVVINDLSENTPLWAILPDWLEKVSDSIDLVIVETKPDRRTATFKELKRRGILQEFHQWTDRDYAAASDWLLVEAKSIGVQLDKKSAQAIIERVGVDQYRLVSALEKLFLSDKPITSQVIDQLIEADPSANALLLFETALSGNTTLLRESLAVLKLQEDPYRVFGLLVSQVSSLAAVHAAGEGDEPSRDFGIHPYVAKKLHSYAKRLSRHDLQMLVSDFFNADRAMKTTSTDPWLLIERALIKTALI